MSLTGQDRKVLSIVIAVLVLGSGMAACGSSRPTPSVVTSTPSIDQGTPTPRSPAAVAAVCPLTGVRPSGGKPVPNRPVAAVKVENTVDAYPLVGLQNADITYEELVEGGLTRFMALYQCKDATKVGPVRSARTTDPKLLIQFNKHPILGYSGAQSAVVNDLHHAGILAYDETSAAAAFMRAAPPRISPHNLFVSVPKLYQRAGKAAAQQGPPVPAFTYDPTVPHPAKKVSSVVVPFSSSVSGDWRWNPASSTWVRQLNRKPMMLEAGGPFQVSNVVIQQVVVRMSKLVDILGNHSPAVTLSGTGKAWILRNGRMVTGTWSHKGPRKMTLFKTKKGVVIPLAPGTSFVELMPKGMTPTFTK